jgi:biopolymer transport protein ExbB
MDMNDLVMRVTAIGSEWVLWLLILLSVASIALTIERALFFWRRRIDIDEVTGLVSKSLAGGDFRKAQRALGESEALECLVLSAGLEAAPRGLHAATETMHAAKARERLHYEARLPFLGTLGNNAPFVGLLGTVIGIIQASYDLASAQAAKQAGASAVMNGVFEALVATAVGLFVALPAVVAFNFFQRQVRTRLLQTDALAHLLISYLKPEPKDSEASGAMEVTSGCQF